MEQRLAPGDGLLVLSCDTRDRARVDEVQYSYPLKLIVPARRFLPGVQGVHVLSYGGGLVAGDRVRLKVDVKERSTLVMLTQGAFAVKYARRASQTEQSGLTILPANLHRLDQSLQGPTGSTALDGKRL